MASSIWPFRVPAITAAVLLGLAVQPGARGDEFVLKTGGRIRGTWVNYAEWPRASYQIRTVHGGLLTLDASLVAVARRQSTEEARV